MDFISVIKNRRSTRIFQEKEVDQETIKKIIEMATYAPSACNIQGWRFIIVNDPAKKQEIVDTGGSVNIIKAPIGILVLYDNRTKNIEYADDIQSASAAIQNMILAAHDLGLGACWVCHLPSKKQLRKIFKIPANLSPIAYITIGYRKNEPSNMPRKYNLDQLISLNEFSSKTPLENINFLKLLILRILMKIYFLIPNWIKKKWLNQYADKNLVKKFKN